MLKVLFNDTLKRQVFTELIEESMLGLIILTHIEGLIIPDYLYKLEFVTLNFSHRFGIADFSYGEEGVEASLSFSGKNFFCKVPWSGVVAIIHSQTDDEYLFPLSFTSNFLAGYRALNNTTHLRRLPSELIQEYGENFIIELDSEGKERLRIIKENEYISQEGKFYKPRKTSHLSLVD
ncbi:MAG: hypothetical protein WC966_10340 [Bradymonadales bacterium]|jgi:hypothetical protein